MSVLLKARSFHSGPEAVCPFEAFTAKTLKKTSFLDKFNMTPLKHPFVRSARPNLLNAEVLYLRGVIWKSYFTDFKCFFFNSEKKKTISTKPSMQSFLPLRKKHFLHFFFSYHDPQFFEWGPRLSRMPEISTTKSGYELSILSNDNINSKWILGTKVYSHCNKGGRCIFH